MATSGYIGINGVARKIKAIYVGVNGVARKVKAAYVGVAGLARKWFSGGGGVTVTLVGGASSVHDSVNSAGAVNGTLIFCGGDDAVFPGARTTDRLYFLNYDTLTITDGSGTGGPEGYSIASATFKDGSKCVFAGGEGYQAGFMTTPYEYWANATVYQYTEALTKTTLTGLTNTMYNMTGVATQNHVLFGGGYARSGTTEDELDYYNVGTLVAYSSTGVRTVPTALTDVGPQAGQPLGNGAIFVESGRIAVSRYNASLVKQTTTNLPVALSGVRSAEIEGNDTTGWALLGDATRTYAINPSGVRTDLPAIAGVAGHDYRAAMGVVLDGEPLALFVFAGSAVSVDANLVVSEPQAGASGSGQLFRMQKDPANKDKFVLNRSVFKAS